MGNRIFLFRIIHVYLARYFTIWKTWYIKFLFFVRRRYNFCIRKNIWLYFPIVYRIKKYPISETKWNMTGHFVGKGKYLCKGRKNSFNTFLRYSYFQLTTLFYINPQVVYITQHTHTDLELILKRILKIMISKGVAGTKNSFSFFNFEVMT